MASAGEVQLADAALDERIKALSDVRARRARRSRPSPASAAATHRSSCSSNPTLTLALLQVRVDDVAAMYTLGDELGRGRFSVVQAATHKVEGSRYAVKVVENGTLDDEENLEALETEITILRRLSHPHIVQLKEVRHRTRARTPSPTPWAHLIRTARGALPRMRAPRRAQLRG